MSEKCCYVICAGDQTVFGITAGPEDMVLAVDGGLAYCGALGLEPDFLIGDFDSVSGKEAGTVKLMEREAPERVVRLQPEKDDTDTLAALRFGLSKGYRLFRIYGGTGGRLEHTIANIQCLLFLKKQGAAGYLCDGGTLIFVLKDEEMRFGRETKGYLSLFSLGREAGGVTIEGMKYPLQNSVLRNDFPIGISNEFTGEEGLVRVENGELVGIVQYA